MAARKIMILGAIGVGKTSLANRLAFDRFQTSYKATIGVDVYTSSATPRGGAPVPLVLWDTDGDFGLTIFRTVYLKGASGAVMVGDVTRPSSLDQLVSLVDGFREALPGRPCAAVFNKSDLAPERGASWAERGGGADIVAATSALTGDGVARVFGDLVGIIERRGL